MTRTKSENVGYNYFVRNEVIDPNVAKTGALSTPSRPRGRCSIGHHKEKELSSSPIHSQGIILLLVSLTDFYSFHF